MANELGSIDKTWSFPEWQYKVKRLSCEALSGI